MKHQLLRHFCSRGCRCVMGAALKTLGLRRPPKCRPFAEETGTPVRAPLIYPEIACAPPQGPRSILYLTHSFYPESEGGTEVFLERLSAAQAALGNKIRIITLSTGFFWEYPEKVAGLLVRRYTWKGIKVLAVRYRHPPSGLYYEQINDTEPLQRDFAQWCLTSFRPDIVHAVYPQPFAAFLRVCRDLSIPYVITATDFCTICPKGTLTEQDNCLCHGSLRGSRCPKDGSLRFEKAEQMLRGAAFFTVPSAFSAERFAAEIKGLQPVVIAHGQENLFCWRCRTAVRHFAFFGALNWSKGALLLVRAFRKLDCDAALDIYGDGPLRLLLKMYQLLDRRIQIKGRVPREELSACYDRADCVVIPSLTAESYSLVLSEAAASGCMVIASDLGALPQRVLEAGGSVFRAGDAAALHRALENAVRLPVFPSKTATLPEKELETYEAIYCKVVQK